MEWWQDNVNVSSGKHVNLYPLIFYYLRYIFLFIIKLQGASFYVSFTFLWHEEMIQRRQNIRMIKVYTNNKSAYKNYEFRLDTII